MRILFEFINSVQCNSVMRFLFYLIQCSAVHWHLDKAKMIRATLFIYFAHYMGSNKTHYMGWCNFTCIATYGVTSAQFRYDAYFPFFTDQISARYGQYKCSLSCAVSRQISGPRVHRWTVGCDLRSWQCQRLAGLQLALLSAIWFYTCQTPRPPSALYNMTSSARYVTHVFERDAVSLPVYNHRWRHSLTACFKNAL